MNTAVSWEEKMKTPTVAEEFIHRTEGMFSYRPEILTPDRFSWSDEEKVMMMAIDDQNKLPVSESFYKTFGLSFRTIGKLSSRAQEFVCRDLVSDTGLEMVPVRFGERVIGFNRTLTEPRFTFWQECNHIASQWPGEWRFDRFSSPSLRDPTFGFWMLNIGENLNTEELPHYPGVQLFFDPTSMTHIAKRTVLFCLSCTNGLVHVKGAKSLTGRFSIGDPHSVQGAFGRLRESVLANARQMMQNVRQGEHIIVDDFEEKRDPLMRMFGVRDDTSLELAADRLPENRYSAYDLQYGLTEVAQRLSRRDEERVNMGVERMLQELVNSSGKPFTRLLKPSKISSN